MNGSIQPYSSKYTDKSSKWHIESLYFEEQDEIFRSAQVFIQEAYLVSFHPVVTYKVTRSSYKKVVVSILDDSLQTASSKKQKQVAN